MQSRFIRDAAVKFSNVNMLALATIIEYISGSGSSGTSYL